MSGGCLGVSMTGRGKVLPEGMGGGGVDEACGSLACRGPPVFAHACRSQPLTRNCSACVGQAFGGPGCSVAKTSGESLFCGGRACRVLLHALPSGSCYSGVSSLRTSEVTWTISTRSPAPNRHATPSACDQESRPQESPLWGMPVIALSDFPAFLRHLKQATWFGSFGPQQIRWLAAARSHTSPLRSLDQANNAKKEPQGQH